MPTTTPQQVSVYSIAPTTLRFDYGGFCFCSFLFLSEGHRADTYPVLLGRSPGVHGALDSGSGTGFSAQRNFSERRRRRDSVFPQCADDAMFLRPHGWLTLAVRNLGRTARL